MQHNHHVHSLNTARERYISLADHQQNISITSNHLGTTPIAGIITHVATDYLLFQPDQYTELMLPFGTFIINDNPHNNHAKDAENATNTGGVAQ